MITVEDIDRKPDFEIRANEFIKKIEELQEKFPNMLISPFNRTLVDLESNPAFIEEAKRDYPEYVDAEIERDRETEAESSYKNRAEINIGSNSIDDMCEFIKNADEIARGLGGKKVSGRMFSYHEEGLNLSYSYDGAIYFDFAAK